MNNINIFLCRLLKSKTAAQGRRDGEAVEFKNLTDLLPLPSEVLDKLDKTSILKIVISYMKAKDFTKERKYLKSTSAVALCLGGPRFDSRPSQTKDFKLEGEAPLSNARHIKGRSMQKLVDLLPE